MPKHTALYDALGLAPYATPDEIKAAFTDRARRLHPDRGGGTDEFHAIRLAFDVLSDPFRRVRYDMTGDTSDQAGEAAKVEQAKMEALGQLVGNVLLGTDHDLVGKDPRHVWIGAIEAQREEIQKALAECRRRMDRAETVLDRLSERTDETSWLEHGIRRSIAELRVAVAENMKGLAIIDWLQQQIEAHEYRVDPPPTGFGFRGSATFA